MPITDIYMAGDINYRSRGAALAPRGRNCSRAFSAHFPANLLDSRLLPFLLLFLRERERERDFSSSQADESRFEAPLLSIESRRLAKNRRPLRVPLLHPPINFYDAGELLLKRACRFLENEIVRGRPECKQSYQRLIFSSPSLRYI